MIPRGRRYEELKAAKEDEIKATILAQEAARGQIAEQARAETAMQMARNSEAAAAAAAQTAAERAAASVAAQMAADAATKAPGVMTTREHDMAKREEAMSQQGQMERLLVAQQEASAARMKAIEEQMSAAAQLMMRNQQVRSVAAECGWMRRSAAHCRAADDAPSARRATRSPRPFSLSLSLFERTLPLRPQLTSSPPPTIGFRRRPPTV